MASDTNTKQPTTILSKTVLIPAGVAAALVLLLVQLTWNIAVEWQRRGSAIEDAIKQVSRSSLSVALMDRELKYFRLNVERKLGPMPDFPGSKPANQIGATSVHVTTVAIPRRRGTDMQANKVLDPGSG